MTNRYKIQRELGNGGMAVVYLAEDTRMNTLVAIKVLRKEMANNGNIHRRFVSEAKSMFRMAHPNIIKVIDLIDDSDTVAFVMEYVEGETLKEYIVRKGRLNDTEIKDLLSQMLDALGYVHEQGLIHRDIKPSNFMITSNGKIKLMDFGIAKNTDSSSSDYTSTGTTQQMGTPMYMSPEQVHETQNVTPQSDIYSLGVVLWQMATGKRPYDTQTLSNFQLQSKIVNEPLENTGNSWDAIIRKATAKQISMRFNNAVEFKRALDGNIDTNFIQQDATIIAEKNTANFYSNQNPAGKNQEAKISPKSSRISFIGSYVYAIKNYGNFKGRTSRRVFWNFVLLNTLISIFCSITVILSFPYLIFSLIPSISIAVRRMHDVGKSGWFAILPIYGFILSVNKGEPLENKYGESVE